MREIFIDKSEWWTLLKAVTISLFSSEDSGVLVTHLVHT